MCHNKDFFTALTSLSRPLTVTLPNEKSTVVAYSRTVMLSDGFFLHGVLYIPSFKYNLLSVSKLCHQDGWYVVFTPKCCLMQPPSVKRPQVLDGHFGGLYLLQFKHVFNQDIAAHGCCSNNSPPIFQGSASQLGVF